MFGEGMNAAINVYSKLGPKITKDFFYSLEKDGIIFDSQNIWLTFKAEGLRGRGIYVTSLKRLSRGRLVLTKSRFIAIAGDYKIIDIPIEHEAFRKLTIDKSDPERYIVKVDSSKFQTELEGNLSLAYHINPDLVMIG